MTTEGKVFFKFVHNRRQRKQAALSQLDYLLPREEVSVGKDEETMNFHHIWRWFRYVYSFKRITGKETVPFLSSTAHRCLRAGSGSPSFRELADLKSLTL